MFDFVFSFFASPLYACWFYAVSNCEKLSSFKQAIGLVARIAQAYLTRRGANQRAQSLFGGHIETSGGFSAVTSTSTGKAAAATQEEDPLVEVLEFIEGPLQQIKRAGLGLLSKGLGRCVNVISLF